ncbi:MAG: cytidylate kinase-like family protein [Phycisphaerales bacterium]|nr:MAG: cytidylate kinase-like family protein [Phycisphaerales bacterium]
MPSGLETIIERQMRNWELSARQQTVPAETGKPIREIRPFVAISRQVGSGGNVVAHKVGERLGWHVYDREILDYMAQQDAVQRRLFGLQDERHEGFLETILSALTPEKPFQSQGYFRKLARAIHTIARNENAVFVGRGAYFLLPHTCGLRVRLIAPIQYCVQRLAQREGLSVEEAEKQVRERGRDRTAFLRARFGGEPWAPDNYDLVLNMADLNPAAAAAIIIEALVQKTAYRV